MIMSVVRYPNVTVGMQGTRQLVSLPDTISTNSRDLLAMTIKVLNLIETSGPGGAENVLINLVTRLDTTRFQPLVCLRKRGWLPGELRRLDIPTVIVPQSHSLDIQWIFRVRRLVRKHAIQILHSHEFAMNVHTSLLSVLSGVPSVATVHGKNYYPELWRRRAAYRFVARTSQLVAVSADIHEFLVRRVGIPGRQILTIVNGIDTSLYAPQSAMQHRLKSELQAFDGYHIVATVGSLYAIKGHSYLLDAARLVIAKHPKTLFLLIGRGPLRDELERHSLELGLRHHVRFLGFRTDIPDLLRAADTFVLPSLSEGLPLSMLEAMAAGKPAIATNVGGVPEVIKDGESGFLIPSRNPDVIADRLIRLIRSPELARGLGTTGQSLVRSKYDLPQVVRQYEELYDRLLHRARRGGVGPHS
jgi:glycosyltransferase involved in cell wall biosynthesis